MRTSIDEGPAAGWARFLADAGIDLPDDEDAAGAPPEAVERDPHEVADERHFFLCQMRATTHWDPDVAALAAAAPRIVIGIGDASRGQVCERTSNALAAALGIEPTTFPGGHTGFVEDPHAFAARLRTALSGSGARVGPGSGRPVIGTWRRA